VGVGLHLGKAEIEILRTVSVLESWRPPNTNVRPSDRVWGWSP